MTFRWGGGFSTVEPFEDLPQIADKTKGERGVLRERVESVRGAELDRLLLICCPLHSYQAY